ncbi:hypothetical protein D3C87_175190 [compost metagenome]
MRVFLFILFLTFVVTCPKVQAAPSTKTEMETLPLDGQSDPLLADKAYLALQEKPAEYHMGIALGYGGGNYLESDEYINSPYLRVHFAPLKREGLPSWEYSIEFNQENSLGFFVGKRWYCCPEDTFLPYYRLSLGSYFDADDGLANFAEIRRLRARGAFGVGRTVFFEMGAGLAVTGPDVYGQLGYNFEF